MAGEDQHDKGEDGLLRAKKWLDRTTRVRRSWTRHDRPMSSLLEFSWPQGERRSYSYDMGGTFHVGDLDGQCFLAEVKNYAREGNQPELFRQFLAKNYAALRSHPERCDLFLWISWAPFQAKRWDEHTSRDKVVEAVDAKRSLILAPEEAADPVCAQAVAERTKLITLSSLSEGLVIDDERFDRFLAADMMRAIQHVQ